MAKLSPDVLDFFRKQGKKGGKLSAKALTAEERAERARKAAAASAAVRSKKAAAKKAKASPEQK